MRANFLEAHYDREYHRALAKLLKLREIPRSCAASRLSARPASETEDRDFQTEADFETVSALLLERI